MCVIFPALWVYAYITDITGNKHNGIYTMSELFICYICGDRGRFSLCELFGWWFITWEPQGFMLVEDFWSLFGLPIPFRALTPYCNSSIGVPNMHPVLGCWWLYLSKSAAGWRINFGSKVLWMGKCACSSTGIPPWLQEVASSGSISPVF